MKNTFSIHRLVMLLTFGVLFSMSLTGFASAAPPGNTPTPPPAAAPAPPASPPAAAPASPASPSAASNPCYTNESNTRTCTYHPFFQVNNPCYLGRRVTGVLQTVVERINTAVETAARSIFEAITGNASFSVIAGASMTLMVAFFAVAFLFGMVQFTPIQGVMRLIKIGFVVWIISPGIGWNFIEDYFIRFFNDGTNYLINAMISIAQTGSASGASSTASQPFQILEGTINLVFSPRMFVTAVASFTTPPYGVAVGLALLWSIFEFVKAIMNALLIYALSLIVKALLFGLAPIFFIFLLFDKTKQLFVGWVNQLVNFSLQPILMFAFLSFFSVLIQSSAEAILARPDTHVCYVHSRQQGSTPFSTEAWEFVCPDGSGNPQPYAGQRTARGPLECPNGRVFPVSVVDILVFLLIVHIASSVMRVIPQLAMEMSQSVVSLDNALSGMNNFGGGGRGGMSASDRLALQRPAAPASTP